MNKNHRILGGFLFFRLTSVYSVKPSHKALDPIDRAVLYYNVIRYLFKSSFLFGSCIVHGVSRVKELLPAFNDLCRIFLRRTCQKRIVLIHIKYPFPFKYPLPSISKCILPSYGAHRKRDFFIFRLMHFSRRCQRTSAVRSFSRIR